VNTAISINAYLNPVVSPEQTNVLRDKDPVRTQGYVPVQTSYNAAYFAELRVEKGFPAAQNDSTLGEWKICLQEVGTYFPYHLQRHRGISFVKIAMPACQLAVIDDMKVKKVRRHSYHYSVRHIFFPLQYHVTRDFVTLNYVVLTIFVIVLILLNSCPSGLCSELIELCVSPV
jgi:hypothetical protein